MTGISTAIGCPAFNEAFFAQLTEGLRRPPLQFHDVRYMASGPSFRLHHARQAIQDTMASQAPLLDQTVVVGYSMGGYLAVQALGAAEIRPRALILIASPASWALRRTEAGYQQGLRAVAVRNHLDADALLEELDNVQPEEEPDVVLANLDVPTLIVRGRRDQVVSRKHAERFAAAGQSELVELDGDHWLKGSEPPIAAACLRFLRRLPATVD